VRLAPPLILTADELEEGLSVMQQALQVNDH
jgi:4-aminobutyrate aminotransferase-like enzyme